MLAWTPGRSRCERLSVTLTAVAALALLFTPLQFCLRGRGRAPRPPLPQTTGSGAMPAKNFASTRYSELNEINTQNVGQLQVAFTFSIGVNKGQEAAPSS